MSNRSTAPHFWSKRYSTGPRHFRADPLVCQCSALHVVSDHFVFAARAAVSAAR